MDNDSFSPFVGGLPAGDLFRNYADGIITLGNEIGVRHFLEERNISYLCLIGLHAYFEAFFKNQFAMLINIHPELVLNLKKNGKSIEVDISKFLTHEGNPRHLFGSILAERFKFGTAEEINSLYKALLQISPFTKKEVRRYSGMLADRNLIVHHGGTYTSWYLEQLKQRSTTNVEVQYRENLDHLVISPKRIESDAKYLKSIVKKTVRASHDELVRRMENKGYPIEDHIKLILSLSCEWGNEVA
jgi:hypothetical protein